MPDKIKKEMTITLGDGITVDLSAIGATLYATRMSTLIYARNKFNKLLEDRTHQPKNPDRVKGIERRKEHHPLPGDQRRGAQEGREGAQPS